MQNSHTQAVLLLDYVSKCIQTLQNTDEVIKNGHSIETGSIGYTSRRQTKQRNSFLAIRFNKLCKTCTGVYYHYKDLMHTSNSECGDLI